MANDDSSKALQPASSRALSISGNQPEGVKARMTQGALEIARSYLIVPSKTFHKVGGYEFCDLDYRQLCLWGEQFAMTPDEIVKMLTEMQPTEEHPSWLRDGYDTYRFTVEDGHIKRLFWNFNKEPEGSFQILDGLLVGRVLLYGHDEVDLFHGESVTPHLPALEGLACIGCGITFLDLSGVPQLTTLGCGENQLTDLDLSGLPQLTELSCEGNQLTELHLLRVSQLSVLRCGGNQLTDLDLSGVPQLTTLDCGGNRLTDLDLSGIPQLTELVCEWNQLTGLDLSGVPQLTEVWCIDNNITNLDLSGVPQLTELCCGGNQLTDLDLSVVPQLTKLWCRGNQLTKLDIRPLNHLKTLDVDDSVRIIGNRP